MKNIFITALIAFICIFTASCTADEVKTEDIKTAAPAVTGQTQAVIYTAEAYTVETTTLKMPEISSEARERPVLNEIKLSPEAFQEKILAPGDRFTVTVTWEKGSLLKEDLIFEYDQSSLSAEFDISPDGSMNIYINGKSPGKFDFKIFSAAEKEIYSVDAPGYSYSIKVLSHSEAKTVYVNPVDRTFHTDRKCSRGAVEKMTAYEALQKGYKPCKKCVH